MVGPVQERHARELAGAKLVARMEHIADLQRALLPLTPAPDRAALESAAASVPEQTHRQSVAGPEGDEQRSRWWRRR
ncbi:hypothetical protein [Streptomyces sp. NPDC055287]